MADDLTPGTILVLLRYMTQTQDLVFGAINAFAHYLEQNHRVIYGDLLNVSNGFSIGSQFLNEAIYDYKDAVDILKEYSAKKPF